MSWKELDNHLEREFVFGDFKAAFQFMTAVSEVINEMDHHPEWTNVYNKVHIRLQTHSAGSKVTHKDRELASAIDGLFQQSEL